MLDWYTKVCGSDEGSNDRDLCQTVSFHAHLQRKQNNPALEEANNPLVSWARKSWLNMCVLSCFVLVDVPFAKGVYEVVMGKEHEVINLSDGWNFQQKTFVSCSMNCTNSCFLDGN